MAQKVGAADEPYCSNHHVLFCPVARQLPGHDRADDAGELTGYCATSHYFAKPSSLSTAAVALPSSLRETANWSRGW
jgi:hypothetical protein